MPTVPLPDPREQLERIARLPGAAVDLVEAALWIAADAQPGLEIEPYLDWFDRAASEAVSLLDRAGGERERIVQLLDYLYGRQGFAGNREEYYDPRNSYLNQVIDRRKGIPISLAVVVLGLGDRLALPLRGVGFPGHFLVRHAEDDSLVIDPFEGALLGARELAVKLAESQGPGAVLVPELLSPAPHRDTLARMLRNLKQIHMRRRELERALSLSDITLRFAPESPLDWRDRGLLHRELECYPEALRDLERCLALGAVPGEKDAIERIVAELRPVATRIN